MRVCVFTQVIYIYAFFCVLEAFWYFVLVLFVCLVSSLFFFLSLLQFLVCKKMPVTDMTSSLTLCRQNHNLFRFASLRKFLHAQLRGKSYKSETIVIILFLSPVTDQRLSIWQISEHWYAMIGLLEGLQENWNRTFLFSFCILYCQIKCLEFLQPSINYNES